MTQQGTVIGLMARAADAASVQFRVLNRSKGIGRLLLAETEN